MNWKRRRTLPSSSVKTVAIVGGTHGNETNGVHLAKHFMRNPALVKRPSFETEVLLSNVAAIQQNTRYVEEDLNRCYLLEDLQNDAKSTSTLERKRAREAIGACVVGVEMKQHGLSLDLSCYTALVEASIRSHDLDLALETLNAMRAELGPRARLPKEHACGFADQWERCVELLKQLQRLPSPPCTSAYYSVVRACCRCKQYPTALQLLQQMEKHGPVHYEASQALRLELVEVDAQLGPKSSSEPKCDFIIDLHNTTAATGVALLMAPNDEFAHEVAHHLMSLDETVRVVEWNDQADWPLCPSIGRSGLTFEVGPCPWGCLEPELFQQSRRLVMALLDYVEKHNSLVASGSPTRQEVSMKVFRSIGVSIDYPRAGEDPVGHAPGASTGRAACFCRREVDTYGSAAGDLAFGSEGKGGPPGDIVIDVSLFGLKRSPTPPPPTPEDLLTPPADAVTLPSGLVTKVIRPGNATAEAATEANRAMVEWYGWTAIDGQLFDASYNRAPGAVEVQQQNVPKGFWEGVKLMKTGETQRFWVMAETSINRFLKIFDGVRLSSLLDLVPLLVSAGVLRSKGQAQGEEEVAAAGGSVLRWLARAGGAFLVGSAVSQVEARSFVKLMEQVNQMGLGQLRPLGMMKVGAFLTDLSRRAGSLEDLQPREPREWRGGSAEVGFGRRPKVSTLNSWRQPAPSEREDDVPEQATEDASGALENVRSEASDVAIPGPSTPEEAQEVLEALEASDRWTAEIYSAALNRPLFRLLTGLGWVGQLEALRVVAQKESVRGIQRLVKDFQKVDRLERLERGIELLDKARLLPRLGGTSSAPKSDFEPWSHLVSIVNAFGGPEDFNKRVEAVNLQHFDECLDVLNAAGLTRKPGQEAMNSRDFSSAVSAWKEVVGILVTAGGPALHGPKKERERDINVFLESLKGIAVEDFLRMVGLLRQAGLARPLDDEDGVEMTRRPSFSYGYGESAGRIRNEMLQDFVQRVIQAGGFHAFWHALKGVDLMKLKGDLHCLAVIRRKLQELIAEDWWLAVHDAEGLEDDALEEWSDGYGELRRKRRADDLTLKQRQQLVKRFREVGGVEAFLDGFANINLSQMLQQHKALHKARIRDVGVIEALSKIGELVKNKVEHLHGLQAVAATLVRWGDRHYRGEEPVRLWKAMHQQVTWLLMAIEENGALLKATVNHGNHPGKEPELTPARLARASEDLG
eukprot:g8105.t1